MTTDTDTTRARVLRMLADGPSYPYALAQRSGIANSTIRRELGILLERGLVEATLEQSPDGPARRVYSLV